MAAVLQDLKPGLHISRLSRENFVCFFRLANLATAYVRIQQVSLKPLCGLLDSSPVWYLEQSAYLMPHKARLHLLFLADMATACLWIQQVRLGPPSCHTAQLMLYKET